MLKGEFVSLCHPERSGGIAAAQSKDLYKNKDGIRIEIPRRARDDGARLPFCVILSGAVGFLPVILSGVARRAAESKDLYSNFVDIYIEIPRQAREDGSVLHDKLGMTGTLSLARLALAAYVSPATANVRTNFCKISRAFLLSEGRRGVL